MMPTTWSTVILYICIPAVLMFLGGLFSFLKTPSEKTSSIVQHFSAGVVIAAVAIELIPYIIQHEIRWVTAVGFAIGVLVMLLTDEFAEHLSEKQNAIGHLPISLIIVVAIDIFIDGILVGVSFIASAHSGIVIALALALETLFLGMSVTIKMTENRVHRAFGLLILLGLALIIILGAVLGYGIVSGLSTNVHRAIIAFGIAALLYLVAEELLIEAHKVPETKTATIAFFIGFLVVLLFT
jgi:ZIP family zinc transporter